MGDQTIEQRMDKASKEFLKLRTRIEAIEKWKTERGEWEHATHKLVAAATERVLAMETIRTRLNDTVREFLEHEKELKAVEERVDKKLSDVAEMLVKVEDAQKNG